MVDGKIIGGLPDFFSEMIESQQCDESFKKDRNMSFVYHDGSIVSILVSKDNSKIRIQSNHLHQQWLLVREFVEKLQDMFGNRPIHQIVSFDQEMPFKDLFDDIELHFQLRKEQRKLLKLLEQRTVQFRMIQKRLLNRFKDKNPSPLNHLDFLLNDTYDQIIQMAMRIEQHRVEIGRISQRLSCSIETILVLTRIKG